MRLILRRIKRGEGADEAQELKENIHLTKTKRKKKKPRKTIKGCKHFAYAPGY